MTFRPWIDAAHEFSNRWKLSLFFVTTASNVNGCEVKADSSFSSYNEPFHRIRSQRKMFDAYCWLLDLPSNFSPWSITTVPFWDQWIATFHWRGVESLSVSITVQSHSWWSSCSSSLHYGSGRVQFLSPSESDPAWWGSTKSRAVVSFSKTITFCLEQATYCEGMCMAWCTTGC